MTIEMQLKQLILDKYGSIRAFTQALNFPYSTIDSMLKRGLGGTSVSTVLAVCLALNIDIEGLLDGRVVPKPTYPVITQQLQTLANALSQLNEEGQEKLLDYAADLVASGRYIKSDPSRLGEKEA